MKGSKMIFGYLIAPWSGSQVATAEEINERLDELFESSLATIEGCLPQVEEENVPESVKGDILTVDKDVREMDKLLFSSRNFLPSQSQIDKFAHISRAFNSLRDAARLVG